MRTEIEIKEKIFFLQKEEKRIAMIVYNDKSKITQPYVFPNKQVHTSWTYDDAMTSIIAQEMTLQWVLGKEHNK